MNQTALFQNDAGAIIDLALNARSTEDAKRINSMIAKVIGERFERPLADRANNHGLMGGSLPSYDALLVELPINGVDSVLELHARRRHPKLKINKMPWQNPREAARDLFAGQTRDQLGQLVQIHTYPSNSNPYTSRLITPVVRDYGVGLTPAMISQTIFYIGSKYKDDVLWQHGAYGLGGAITYRNAQSVLLVSRRQPELLGKGEEDVITVAVCEWQGHTKGEGLYYLVSEDWRLNNNAQPWSAPANEYPDFEPGLHLALIDFQTKKFHGRKSDRDSIEIMLQTRLSDPVLPIGLYNHVAIGDHFKIPVGNRSVFENNPRTDRVDENDVLLVHVNGKSHKLPVRWHVFKNGPNADIGGMRTFVWDKQAVHFTNNGYAHRHWTQQDLRIRVPKLSQLYDRLHVIVETDSLPIGVRTKLFTPDRSTMRDTIVAEQLEDALKTFLKSNETLLDLNGELIRQRLSSGQSKSSTRKVAEKIAKAITVRGFATRGRSGDQAGAVAKPRNRIPKQLYSNPTTLEGPESVWIIPGVPKHINLHLNATDDFMPDRGNVSVHSSCSLISEDNIEIGKLRNGRIRVQLATPESLMPGDTSTLKFEIKDWLLTTGGAAIGNSLVWETEVSIVEEAPRPPTPKPEKENKDKGNKTDTGSLVAVLWRSVDDFDTWDKYVPGHIENISAIELSRIPDYAELASLGGAEVQTIWLNDDYSPLTKYTQARISSTGASGAAIEQARERYVLGVGVALLDYANFKQNFEKEHGQSLDDRCYKFGCHAAAQGVVAMLPEYDELVKVAGIEE